MPTSQISTEPETSFTINVNPLTEIQVFDFIKGMYVNDLDNDWYATVTDKYENKHSGLLQDVENETVVLSSDFSGRAQIKVAREDATTVRIWRVL